MGTVKNENVSYIDPLHQYLNTSDWNTEGLKKILAHNPSSVNTVIPGDWRGEIPLLKLIRSGKCSAEDIELLLDHGADINYKNKFNITPLWEALMCCKSIEVIEILLDKGASIEDNVRNAYQSPLCLAIASAVVYRNPKRLKLMLEAGYSIHTCRAHASAMHCFCEMNLIDKPWPHESWKDVLKLLLEAGAELSTVDDQGRSPLCLALVFNATGLHIDYLIRMGCKLSDCQKHISPFDCILDHPWSTLRGGVVQTLRAHGDTSDCVGMLHRVLGTHRYEVKAIEELLDVPGVDVNGELLHSAVKGYWDQVLKVIKLLLDKGADVGKLNAYQETALDVAVKNGQSPEIIELLLKKGSFINTQDGVTSKPLKLAIECPFRHQELVERLLLAGARIGLVQNPNRHPLLTLALEGCVKVEDEDQEAPIEVQDEDQEALSEVEGEDQDALIEDADQQTLVEDEDQEAPIEVQGEDQEVLIEVEGEDQDALIEDADQEAALVEDEDQESLTSVDEALLSFKLLVKFYFLEYSSFEIEDMIQENIFYYELRSFANDCINELHRMESKTVGHGLTLRQLVNRESLPQVIPYYCMAGEEDFNLSQLLVAISNDAFPLYFDVIVAKLRKSMEKKLEELPVYTIQHCPDSPHLEKKVTLCTNIKREIASHLSDIELVNFMVAFYKPEDHGGSKCASNKLNI